MRKITDIISKPSEALQAMVDGLLEQDQRSDFRIDMATFGNYDPERKICFGCAATCTAQKLAGINFTGKEIDNEREREYFLDIKMADYNDFENVIDSVRRGAVSDLFDYFDIGTGLQYQFDAKFDLENDNWKEQIPEVLQVIEDLKKKGF